MYKPVAALKVWPRPAEKDNLMLELSGLPEREYFTVAIFGTFEHTKDRHFCQPIVNHFVILRYLLFSIVSGCNA